MKILMVLNSHHPAGSDAADGVIALREFAVPYYVLRDAGAEITLAARYQDWPDSPPEHADTAGRANAERRFTQDAAATAAMAGLREFKSLSTTGFDAVFYPAGQAARWEWRTDH